MLTSPDYFDRLANGGLAHYHHQREAYRHTVDDIVLQHSPPCPRHFDIGCGDGERANRLNFALSGESLTLCDNSPLMCKQAQRKAPTLLHSVDNMIWKESLHGQFDLITCLGNVLGHCRSIHLAMSGFWHLLAPGGVVVFDVHNRYNIAEYGCWNVAKNVFFDWTQCPLDNGYFSIIDHGYQTRVKIHTQNEIERNFCSLMKERRYYVDYKTGHLKRTQWSGQLVYVLSKPLLNPVSPGTRPDLSPPNFRSTQSTYLFV